MSDLRLTARQNAAPYDHILDYANIWVSIFTFCVCGGSHPALFTRFPDTERHIEGALNGWKAGERYPVTDQVTSMANARHLGHRAIRAVKRLFLQ
jgi:hypothetical protein